VGDGEITRVGLRHADPEQRAVINEDLPDVCREIAEEVADVAVLGDPAARQPRAEVISVRQPSEWISPRMSA